MARPGRPVRVPDVIVRVVRQFLDGRTLVQEGAEIEVSEQRLRVLNRNGRAPLVAPIDSPIRGPAGGEADPSDEPRPGGLTGAGKQPLLSPAVPVQPMRASSKPRGGRAS